MNFVHSSSEVANSSSAVRVPAVIAGTFDHSHLLISLLEVGKCEGYLKLDHSHVFGEPRYFKVHHYNEVV